MVAHPRVLALRLRQAARLSTRLEDKEHAMAEFGSRDEERAPAASEFAFVFNDSPEGDDARFATVKSREDFLASLTPLTRSRVSVLALADDAAEDRAPPPELRARGSRRRASKRQRPPTPVSPKGRKCGAPSRKAWCCVAPQ